MGLDAITIFAIVFMVAGAALELYAVRIPEHKILSDIGKFIVTQQYEQLVTYVKACDKKKLARELKRLMKDAEKKDRKGIPTSSHDPNFNQKARFRFAYELYVTFVGELKVKKDFLDQCHLADDHEYAISQIRKILSD